MLTEAQNVHQIVGWKALYGVPKVSTVFDREHDGGLLHGHNKDQINNGTSDVVEQLNVDKLWPPFSDHSNNTNNHQYTKTFIWI